MDAGTAAVVGPFLIPLGAFAVAIVAIYSRAWRSVQTRRLAGEQRLAMLGRGMSIAEIEQVLSSSEENDRRSSLDPSRSLRNARRAGTILASSGIGLIIFGLLLGVILRNRDVLVVAATGVIPLAIGVGFWFDYRTQAREIARLGLGLPDSMMSPERSR